MTGTQKRNALIAEVRELSAKRVALESSTLSPEMKKSCDRRYRDQIGELVAVLGSPVLAAICPCGSARFLPMVLSGLVGGSVLLPGGFVAFLASTPGFRPSFPDESLFS
jgi:hypothetical protein